MLCSTTGLAVLSRIAIGPSSLTGDALPFDPIDSIRNILVFFQRVRAFLIRSYLLAVSFTGVNWL